MKQLLAVFFLLPFVLSAQKISEKKFLINGKISGLPERSLVTLSDVNNPTDTVARGFVTNASFVLQGAIPEPNLYHLNFDSAKKKAVIFLSNDNISINGSLENIQTLKIKGSQVQDDFQEFQDVFNPLFQKLSLLNQQISGKPSIQRDDSAMIAYTDHFKKIQSTIEQFVQKKKSSPLGPFLLVVTSELEQDPLILEKRFRLLDEKMQKGFYGRILAQQIADTKIGAVGTEAIAFTQNDTTGHPVSLSSFRGKYVLVDFWASWCKPCRMENPNVVANYSKFKNKNFTVLGVSLDRSRDPWLQAIKDDQLTWTHVSDLKFWNNEAAMKYRIQSIPKNFLIDPKGKIIAKDLRGPDLELKLCELLGCK